MAVRKKGKTWQYVVDVGFDPVTNKRKQKTKAGFNTKKEAQLAAAEIERQVKEKTYITVTEQTLKEFTEVWKKSVAKNKMKQSTYENRVGIINDKIIPVLGHVKIKDIEASSVQALYGKMINDDGFSTAYVRRIHDLLSSIFNYAKKQDKIKINIMKKVDAPTVRHTQMNTWSQDEISKFLSVAVDSPVYVAYVLALYTGMRKGEILGLRWKDIDFDKKTIHITQALTTISGKLTFQEPKTERSARQVGIDIDIIIDALESHREKQTMDSELVITTSIGTPYSPRNLNRNFKALIKKAGVTDIRFHDLRHTHATMLLKLDVNPKIVSERLGHSDVTTTLNTYSHVLPDMQNEATKKLSDYLSDQNATQTE